MIFPLTLNMRREVLAGIYLDDEGIVLKKLLDLYFLVDLLAELGVPAIVDYFFHCELFACVIDQRGDGAHCALTDHAADVVGFSLDL